MPADTTDAAAALRHDISLTYPPDQKHEMGDAVHAIEPAQMMLGAKTMQTEYIDETFPSEEELHSLRRVSDHIPLRTYLIAFVELCERFSYYGTTVVYTDFIQQPNPQFGSSGAGIYDDPDIQQSGALGMGQRASTGLGTFNTFWVYIIPLFGAYIADTYWGRYKTICVSIAVAIVGHVILVASAAPMVLENLQGAKAAFILGMIIMGVGTGGFKPNISPLVAEQIVTQKMHVISTKSGERVIVDPAVTAARVYNWFYLFINIGALVGQVAMSFAELYVGFWLAYLLPTALFLLCPIVMVVGRKRYNLTPPQGSVLGPAMKIFNYCNKGRWSINPVTTYKKLNDGTFWETAKPSNVAPSERPSWMTYDDAWVDEVKRGFKACSVFLFMPFYWLCYNQLNNNLISQAATMTRNGLPTEIVSNLDPFALIILIPICDLFIYPALRRAGFNFTPIKRIAWGFFTASASMIWAAVLQYYIYQTNPCGYEADAATCEDVSSLNVWIQSGSYILIAISEILASITTLEYAFTKAPKNMRSLVMSVNLFMSAISAALGEAFVPLAEDPLLIWNYGVFAVVSFIAGVLFWLAFRKLDANEDKLNMLPSGHIGTKDQEDLERRMSVASPDDLPNSKVHEKGIEHGSPTPSV